MFRKIQKSKNPKLLGESLGFLDFWIFGFLDFQQNPKIQKSKNPKLLGKSLEVLDFGIFGFSLFFWIFMKNPKTPIEIVVFFASGSTKPLYFLRDFWIFHKNPEKQWKSNSF